MIIWVLHKIEWNQLKLGRLGNTKFERKYFLKALTPPTFFSLDTEKPLHEE